MPVVQPSNGAGAFFLRGPKPGGKPAPAQLPPVPATDGTGQPPPGALPPQTTTQTIPRGGPIVPRDQRPPTSVPAPINLQGTPPAQPPPQVGPTGAALDNTNAVPFDSRGRPDPNAIQRDVVNPDVSGLNVDRGQGERPRFGELPTGGGDPRGMGFQSFNNLFGRETRDFIINKVGTTALEKFSESVIDLAKGPLKAPGIEIGRSILVGEANSNQEAAADLANARDAAANRVRLGVSVVRGMLAGRGELLQQLVVKDP